MHVQIGMADVPKVADLREVQWANTSSIACTNKPRLMFQKLQTLKRFNGSHISSNAHIHRPYRVKAH
jgi:hypothetical protein